MAAPLRIESPDDRRMELTEHLGELRIRLFRSILFLVIGAVVAYHYFTPLYGVLYKPFEKEMQAQNRMHAPLPFALPGHIDHAPTPGEYNALVDVVKYFSEHPFGGQRLMIAFHNFHEPFMVELKISVVYGFILVMPFVVWQLAGFITPALTPKERKPLRLLVPLSVLLLISGVTVAYGTMFYAMHWFLSYLSDFPQPANLMQDPNDYILFFVKMMAAFGIAFQLPVVLMAGAFMGMITSKGLIKNWRWGIMIAALGALFTPSNDFISMALMAIPLLLLYVGSIFLVRLVERSRDRERFKPA